ncbi:hypothetical protein EVAR_42379_1 [Eumeta japonica]|uniref:Uncharacterized protein n=1 Tax=Eumeta variegata TaxID=151549 RepID=A0A4C1YG50_EUMVA|nr:hypothetical protein EVAR_42379_1 [Eumeta japonica]
MQGDTTFTVIFTESVNSFRQTNSRLPTTRYLWYDNSLKQKSIIRSEALRSRVTLYFREANEHASYQKRRWSSPPMGSRNSKKFTSAVPVSWIRIGSFGEGTRLMEGEKSNGKGNELMKWSIGNLRH